MATKWMKWPMPCLSKASSYLEGRYRASHRPRSRGRVANIWCCTDHYFPNPGSDNLPPLIPLLVRLVLVCQDGQLSRSRCRGRGWLYVRFSGCHRKLCKCYFSKVILLKVWHVVDGLFMWVCLAALAPTVFLFLQNITNAEAIFFQLGVYHEP